MWLPLKHYSADDTKCFTTIFNPAASQLLQDIHRSLINWSNEWNLNFNSAKIFQLSLKSTAHPIAKIDHHCDLSAIFSANLSWEPHYQHIISKAYKKISFTYVANQLVSYLL